MEARLSSTEVRANTSPLQSSADSPEAAAQAAPALSEVGLYCASVLAATALNSGVDELGLRRLFTGCDETGLGLGPDFEAAVLSEHAALRAS
jgi:hypothetical protein